MKISMTKPVVCCGFTPCIQRRLVFEKIVPKSVNRVIEMSEGIGGKGANVARVLKQLGGESLHVGFVGGDNGHHFESLMAESGVDCAHVRVQGNTRYCQTLIERGNPEVTELVEEMPALSLSEWEQMLDLFDGLDLSGMVTISGKLPAGAPESGYAEMVRRVQARGGRVLLDTAGAPLLSALSEKPFFVKINEHELLGATGQCELRRAARQLLGSTVSALMITRGADSAFLFAGDDCYELVPPVVEAINPIGSGDSVLAGWAYCLAGGERDLLAAARFSMACGVANALQAASGYVDVSDVRRLVDQVLVTRHTGL
jgi:tagatose 6-phosphate kinase